MAGSRDHHSGGLLGWSVTSVLGRAVEPGIARAIEAEERELEQMRMEGEQEELAAE